MKEYYPVQIAEYDVSKGIADEPSLYWWVTYTIKKRNVIISAIKAQLKDATHQYGVEIPNSIEHDIRLDAINVNLLWQEALDKEIHIVSVAFEILPTVNPVPDGWKKSSGHLIWDVKMDFT